MAATILCHQPQNVLHTSREGCRSRLKCAFTVLQLFRRHCGHLPLPSSCVTLVTTVIVHWAQPKHGLTTAEKTSCVNTHEATAHVACCAHSVRMALIKTIIHVSQAQRVFSYIFNKVWWQNTTKWTILNQLNCNTPIVKQQIKWTPTRSSHPTCSIIWAH